MVVVDIDGVVVMVVVVVVVETNGLWTTFFSEDDLCLPMDIFRFLQGRAKMVDDFCSTVSNMFNLTFLYTGRILPNLVPKIWKQPWLN